MNEELMQEMLEALRDQIDLIEHENNALRKENRSLKRALKKKTREQAVSIPTPVPGGSDYFTKNGPNE